MTGQDVKALREKLGWSQEKLAEYLGVKQPTVWRMENGARILGPTKTVLEQLAANPPAPAPAPEAAA